MMDFVLSCVRPLLEVLHLSLQGHLGEFELVLIPLSRKLCFLLPLLNFSSLIFHPLLKQVWTRSMRVGRFVFLSHSANVTA